jgi:alpha-1,6-mannosyltransferase
VLVRRRGPLVALAFVLVGSVVVLIGAHLAVAALTVCLNETPALAHDFAQALPGSGAAAQALLPLLGPLGVDSGQPAACEPAAPARAMALAGLAYLVGIFALDRAALPSRAAWVLVCGVAATIRVVLFFMPALLSSDIIDYASHGRVAALHNANPYLVTPSAFPSDPYSGLGAWPTVATVYGPLWTHVDAALTGLLADATTVQLALAYKAVALLADVVCAALIVWITARWCRAGVGTTLPVVALAMWTWNPLVNVELVGNAHNEAVMLVFILVAFALMTRAGSSRAHVLLWFTALLALWLGALIKFIPAAIEGIVALVWLRQSTSWRSWLVRAGALLACMTLIGAVVAWQWLDSPAVAAPLVGLASGGQRVKDAWQDAPAAWLTVRVVPRLGVPDDPATLRMDVARVMVWSFTRAVFVVYVLLECRLLWMRASSSSVTLVRNIATVSVRALLMAILLYVSQVYPWYFLWPLPVACLLGPREAWSRAAVVFGLTFLPAYYLREFDSYGVFYVPLYALLGLFILGFIWMWQRVPRFALQYLSAS